MASTSAQSRAEDLLAWMTEQKTPITIREHWAALKPARERDQRNYQRESAMGYFLIPG
jgi:hypothetical protein